MSSWLFQFNPDTFDGDGYLLAIDDEFAWRVSMHWLHIRQGDQVFIWKAMGANGTPQHSDVVAEASVISDIRHEAIDPQAQQFIRAATFPRTQRQTWLRLARRTTPKIAVSREIAIADRVPNTMTILAFGGTTNHRLTHEQAARITELLASSKQ